MSAVAALPAADATQVAVAGVRFALHRAGPTRRRRTTPTLLLHGVPETSRCWSRLLPELARDRVVLAPDLKGLGGSEARAPYDLPTLVSELAALVLHEADGPVDVVGHDWGGRLALGLAGHRPELVRRLVVMSAPYRRVDPARMAYVPALALPVLPELAFRVAGERLVREVFRRAWRASEPPEHLEHYVAAYAPPERVAAMLGYYRATVSAAAGGLLRRAVGAPQRGPDLPPVRVERSLVVWGTHDPPLPLHVGESVVRDLGASTTLLTLPGVGHFPVEEAPDVVVPAVSEFLRVP